MKPPNKDEQQTCDDEATYYFLNAFRGLKFKDRVGVFFSVALVLVGALQYLVYTKQAGIMDNQLEEMRLEDRAWVGPTGAGMQLPIPKDKLPRLLIMFGNMGRQPATHFTQIAAPMDTNPAHAQAYINACKAGKLKMADIGVIYPSSASAYTFGTDVPAEFSDKSEVHVVAGCFLYDTQRRRHFSTFCVYWSPTGGNDLNTWSFCPLGNDAD